MSPRPSSPLPRGSDSALICGSRDWPEDKLWFVTSKVIELVPSSWTLIAGGARGVDRHVEREAIRLRRSVQVVRADWDRHGKRAGFLRNLAMLDMGPSLVLAFHWGNSKGTAHTIREAHKRGIQTCVFNEKSLRPDIAALDQDYEPIGGTAP